MKVWLIFDERGWFDTDKAFVLDAFSEDCNETLEEVLQKRNKDWPHAVVYEYDVSEDGKTLVNKQLIG